LQYIETHHYLQEGYLMSVLDLMHRGVDRFASLPPLLAWRRKRFNYVFERAPGTNLFRGVYGSYEEAARAAPTTRPLGYNHPGAAQLYRERCKHIYPSDYAPLFWLSRLFSARQCHRIFDFGGHVGVSYYSYAQVLPYPQDLQWTVYDVPAVVARGREIAATEDVWGKLKFTETVADAAEADVLLAFGSLQYLQGSLGDELRGLHRTPPHVIVNMLPVHPAKTYFTVQDIGPAFCPYRIVAEPELLQDMQRMGYARVDCWENLDKHCQIHCEPQFSLDRYHGYYFRSGN
jgi:putative methyltransferase (TIGR04325 family)